MAEQPRDRDYSVRMRDPPTRSSSPTLPHAQGRERVRLRGCALMAMVAAMEAVGLMLMLTP